uniref:Uncharacterized protein n=1 Tax=Lepeophtheirus salmonis TaxID=72036 RepID=A0A0K2UY07_LEPSM
MGDTKHQVMGSKLLPIGQVLKVLFHNIREVNMSVNQSDNFTVCECVIFWGKARAPTNSLFNIVKKPVQLYQSWRYIKKNFKKLKDAFNRRREEFIKYFG